MWPAALNELDTPSIEEPRERQSKFTPPTQLKLELGIMAACSKPVMNISCRLVAPSSTRLTVIGGYPKVTSYYMLGEQRRIICQFNFISTKLDKVD